MKKCPYCAEEIQDDAIFCRYCRRDLPPPPPPIPLKCPHCATEYQISAIVSDRIICRFCGRAVNMEGQNFLAPEPVVDMTEMSHPDSGSSEIPIWKDAVKFGAVLALLSFISMYLDYHFGRINSAEFTGRVLTGVPVNFIVWSVVGFPVVWIWRKLRQTFSSTVLIIGGLGLILIICLIISFVVGINIPE